MVSDEAVISALLQSKTIRQAAELCGVGETSMYAKLRDPAFQESYREARIQMLERTKNRLQSEMLRSVETLAQIRDDVENAPQVRVNAADGILRHGCRMTELFDVLARIEALESRMDGDGRES